MPPEIELGANDSLGHITLQDLTIAISMPTMGQTSKLVRQVPYCLFNILAILGRFSLPMFLLRSKYVKTTFEKNTYRLIFFKKFFHSCYSLIGEIDYEKEELKQLCFW